jgi:protein-S-isoprenylcysteine O-methyltransferase Ste14
MRWLELKVPPPIVALVTGVVMWLASSLFAPFPDPFCVRASIAVVLACLGAAIDVVAIVTFRRASTTVHPMKPQRASTLVTSGVFGFSRNPMYLGMVLYLVAWAVYLSNWLAALIVPLFVLYMNRFQIAPEERVLESLFGEKYAAYKETVGRWV